MPPRARAVLDAVGLVCSDLPRSVAFYRALGCDVPEPDGTGHLEVDLGGVRLMLDTEAVVASFAPDTWTGSTGGRLGLAARCESPEDVDALHDLLVPLGQGSHLAPFDAFWGQRYASVLDPDGSSVDLYAALPGAPVLQVPPG